jgi:hypothetical protein
MQLRRPISIGGALAAATSSLLAVEPARAEFVASDSPWLVDAAILFYSEQDRVNVTEPVLQAKKEIGDGEFITVKVAYDSMSGATPNGAVPTDTVQTFSTPSGESSETTPAHEMPLVEFSDSRAALSVDWEKPITRTLRTQLNVNFSKETDYQSLGAGASLLLDLNNRLTTLTLGAAANADDVSPTGGAPVELSPIDVAQPNDGEDEDENEEGDDDEDEGPGKSKTGYDLLVGVTQVLTRQTLMQLNYTYGVSSGYLTDPYKILSVIDGTTGATLPGQYVHEKRPDSRIRNAVYWKMVHQFTEDVVHVSYRYYWDDWDIRSHTVDLTYRLEIGDGFYLEPHYRWYTQTAAKFFRYSLFSGEPQSIDYASADPRLAELQSNTLGLRFANEIGQGVEWGIGVDYMVQTGDKHPPEAVGVQKNEELFHDLKALSITADFSIIF